jgi:outer membrane lipoprotein-sorting protein
VNPRTVSKLALAALLAAATVSGAAAADTPTLDQILDQHFAALGGRDKIAAVQTVKMTGKQQFGPQEATFTLYWKRPDKIRMEIVLQGKTGVQAYDGTQAWMVMPFLGKTDPEEMTGDDLKDMIEQADLIEGPLFNWKQKGHQVELLGKESVEGTDAWKLKVTLKDGEVSYVWLDADALLEIKSEGTHKRGDQEIQFETSTGDYKETGGLLFPHSIEQRRKGAPEAATITIDDIQLDGDVPDSLFPMPAPAPKPADAPAGN